MITGIRNTQQRQNFGISEENISKGASQAIKYGKDSIKTPQTNTSSPVLEAYLKATSLGDFLVQLHR